MTANESANFSIAWVILYISKKNEPPRRTVRPDVPIRLLRPKPRLLHPNTRLLVVPRVPELQNMTGRLLAPSIRPKCDASSFDA